MGLGAAADHSRWQLPLTTILVLVCMGQAAAAADRQQLDWELGVQLRLFADDATAGQARSQPSLRLEPEFYREWQGGNSSLTLRPFARLDGQDSRRSHVDLREAFLTRVGDSWELHAGVRRVFWGVTEFQHLVDVVNQTDLVENIDGEDKLGQPMVQLSLLRSWGVLDLFVLPGFRERTFPGNKGRLRVPLRLADSQARYASGAGRRRVDGALRWSRLFGDLELGVSHFSGTSREPRLVPEAQLDSSGGVSDVVLVPVYETIDQTGIDAQLLSGPWAWKLELISRSGQGRRFSAATAGFERTVVGALGTRADLGLVLEYLFDDRGDQAPVGVFERDLAFGLRWALNDPAGSQALVGLIWDPDTSETLFSIEAGRRLGNNWTLELEARVFGGSQVLDRAAVLNSPIDPDNKSGVFQADDFLQLELVRFF